jgi:hypothetical protein
MPAAQLMLLTVVVAFTTGYRGLPEGMITAEVLVGTVLPPQLPGVSQAVLIFPVQLKLVTAGVVPMLHSSVPYKGSVPEKIRELFNLANAARKEPFTPG